MVKILISSFLGFAFWGVVSSSWARGETRLGSIQVLSADPGPAAVPAAAVDQSGMLHVVWADAGRGKFDIQYRAVGAASVPEDPVPVSNTPGLSSGPKIVASTNNRIYAVWHDSTPPKTRLYLRRIARDGVQSDPAKIITPETQGAFTPSMAVDREGRLHVAWADRSTGNYEILYRPSDPRDNAAALPLNLSENRGKSLVPSVAADSCGTVHVAWHDDSRGPFDVFLRTLRAGSGSFGPAVNVSSSAGLSGAPAVVAWGCGRVYVLWPDASPGNFEILARVSTDFGRSFGPVRNLSGSPRISIRPAVGVDRDGTLHLTWIDGDPNRFQVFYRCMAPDLGTASKRVQISASRGIAGAPAIAVIPEGAAYVLWIDNDTGPFKVFMREVQNCKPRAAASR